MRAWNQCQTWSETHVGVSTHNSSFSRNGLLLDGNYDADGNSLKRHEHEDDDDNRDPKRVRFTDKQPFKLADSEVTDDKDADATRA